MVPTILAFVEEERKLHDMVLLSTFFSCDKVDSITAATQRKKSAELKIYIQYLLMVRSSTAEIGNIILGSKDEKRHLLAFFQLLLARFFSTLGGVEKEKAGADFTELWYVLVLPPTYVFLFYSPPLESEKRILLKRSSELKSE